MSAVDAASGVKRGFLMRVAFLAIAGLSSIAAAKPAEAATIVVFTHPETLEQKMVVVDREGPDRLFMCVLPPGEAGCHRVAIRRRG
jgi:hypothetical protein